MTINDRPAEHTRCLGIEVESVKVCTASPEPARRAKLARRIDDHTTRRSNNPLKTNAQGQSQSQIPVTAVLSSHGAVRVFRTGRSAVRRTGRRFIDNRIPLPPGSPTALHFGCFRKFSPLATGRAADTQIARKCANESLEPCKPLIVSIMGFVRQTREPPCRYFHPWARPRPGLLFLSPLVPRLAPGGAATASAPSAIGWIGSFCMST